MEIGKSALTLLPPLLKERHICQFNNGSHNDIIGEYPTSNFSMNYIESSLPQLEYSFKTGGPWLKKYTKLLGNTEYEERVQLLNLVLLLSCRMDKKDIILA